MKWGALAVAGVLALLLGGCARSNNGAARLTVATSTNVLAHLIRQVTGDEVTVVYVTPDGQSPLTFQPAPQDVIKLSGAQVYFENGLFYEGALENHYRKAGMRVVTLSNGLLVRQTQIDHGDHGHMFPNAYLYMNVRHAISYVETIRETMIEIDAPNAERYRSNAERYLSELRELDAWIEREIEQIPPANRTLMKDKASFTYFADRYGLKDYAASYEGTSEAAPAPSQYAALVDQVKRERVRVVFGEVGYSSKLMQQLANDTGTRFVDGLRVTTLGTSPQTGTYAEMMRENTRIIVNGLR